MSHQPDSPRVLLLSQRNIYDPLVWRCSFAEFETILERIEAVDVVAPRRKSWFLNGKRLALRLGEKFKTPLNPALAPGIEPITLTKDYDVFFAVVEGASELLHINAVKGWKDRCKTSVCFLVEFYIKDIPTYKSCMEVLAQFDYVFYMFVGREPFEKRFKSQGQYLAAGIDTLRYCPYPNPPQRSIDVMSIGRRAEKTHQALLRMAREEGLFYVHDTIDSLRAYSVEQHRRMMSDMAKRSRYFLVNPGKFNKPEETGGQSEFGYRYFEGAAPGAIMIGDVPRNNQEFSKIFHWEDAVIQLDLENEDIAPVIRELDSQPERQMRIRRNNMVQCLLHHDWAYRWESILETVGLAPLPALLQRKEILRKRAAMVEEALVEPNAARAPVAG